jgi:hypothetical protein
MVGDADMMLLDEGGQSEDEIISRMWWDEFG